MANVYKTHGTSALKPQSNQSTANVIEFPSNRRESRQNAAAANERRIAPVAGANFMDVVSILSCFDGVPFAQTDSDRKFAVVAGIIGTLSLFVLSFGSLF